MAAAAAMAPALPAYAGPFVEEDFAKLVPADKKLRPEWVASLTARGTPEVWTGPELEKIGMPVGGIGAGHVYLGGEGQLWHWDIFNKHIGTGDGHYAKPMAAASPLEQGFAVRVTAGGKTQMRPLDKRGFADVRFRGEYPIGTVTYKDAECPAAITLEAFSPYIPLNTDDSSLPATVLRYTIRNTSDAPIEAELAGWIENPVGLYTTGPQMAMRRNRILRSEKLVAVECSMEAMPEAAKPSTRPDIVFEDFEKETYEGWTTTGTAFGSGPVEKAKMPDYQGDVGAVGKRLVNSHNTSNGEDVAGGDKHIGTLTSKAFTIERNYINFLIGGGNHPGKTCVNLLVENKVVASATGKNDNHMGPASFDTRQLQGRTGQIQIVDNETGAWGNIGVDQIVFSDSPGGPDAPLDKRHDYGTLCLACAGVEGVRGSPMLPDQLLPLGLFDTPAADGARDSATRPIGLKLVGAVARKVGIAAGREVVVTFIVAWCFPNLALPKLPSHDGRWYAKKFGTAAAVASHIVERLDALYAGTQLWRSTWYDSTLPYWFLDRVHLNTSILATSTCFRLGDGRFYGWEGVGCCEGTCTHVWQYAQAVARLFPDLERDTRQRVDLGVGFDEKTGCIGHRGELNRGPAIDGQAGTILRCYREHQMSPNSDWLKSVWPKVRKAVEYLITKDGNNDGVLEGPQWNTLDADWFGYSPWLSGMYLASLRAAGEMATEAGDADFAKTCRGIFDVGCRKLDELTWKEDYQYFIQVPDKQHLAAVGAYYGCDIDQVFADAWSQQVNLGRILPQEHVRKALASLWQYSYTPDVGPYRAAHKPGRWYAMAGEGGLLMVTHPFGQSVEFKNHPSAWSAMYFNECMTGFEYQAAWHMIGEGMLTEGLAIARTIHDRYHPLRRNPYNEVECGDHYARAMAAYGLFVTLCGFEYHGPKGSIGFAPRLNPRAFKAAFTAAEGWGSYSQELSEKGQACALDLKQGRLRRPGDRA
ncbi:MAG: GH116 family glycosyl-hydrolase [Tepidisphaeraceae bacterium]